MTATELRQIFDRAISQQKDADKVARLELCREFFTNPEFRAALSDEVARVNGVEA